VKLIKFLAIVPARKNSKRIKNKNLIKFKNVTLVENTLKQIDKIKDISLSVISSDSNKILNYSRKIKNCIPIKRPKNISTDQSSTEEVIYHVITDLEKKRFFVENIILLQVTSPLRSIKDIKNSIKQYKREKLKSIFSCYLKKSFIWKKKNNSFNSISYDHKKRIKSQNMKNLYFENGAIYIFNLNQFKKEKNRIMKPFGIFTMTEKNSLDIDTKEDLEILKKLR
jgi:CMP-N,N'-diacetyllegionaminic acid synthase